ncbi:DUF429 domain-containing protein [Asaia bogorensis]|uniref:DUF429 domain-containing protein n=1 Tax=Asaia bogorensis TaxID=91915 RepID=UPI0028619392|nr:DUF429 domain-containing protein [Asaia bogorensis]MDR6182158.1 putative RNase H-like nuclease [Asaia bogorensis NBRC 16594]
MDTYIGFDSAWTDKQKSSGAICTVTMDGSKLHAFIPPRLATFSEALEFIRSARTEGVTQLALDQPTIVPNLSGSRPVEKVAGSVIGWMGGGVQPSNRGRTGMFCDASPIWKFLQTLNSVEDPEEARVARHGLYRMEVFPALALASFDPGFFGRLAAPKYNPVIRKKFRLTDWKRVARAAAREAEIYQCAAVAEWCREAEAFGTPRKADQDRLDAILCLLIALRWRLMPREASIMLGDLANGYIVAPCSPQVRERLQRAAQQRSVKVDGRAR